MKKLTNAILTLLILLMIGIIAFTIPSANITSEAKRNYIDDLDEAKSINSYLSQLFLKSVLAEGSFGQDVAIPIPVEEKTGRTPILENFTENSYEDSTIKVKMEHGRFEDADYHVAYVEIADPTQLRTGLAGKLGSDRCIKITDLAPKYNSVVAINGDFYTQTKSGFIIRQGEVYRKKTSDSFDLLFIDSNGDFHVIQRGGDSQLNSINAIKEKGEIVNAFCFGPALVINGEMQKVPDDYRFAPHGKNPRAAIAQMGPLKYAMIVVDGRMENSDGVTLQQFAELMKQLGCQQAYNLDGGNSAGLFFKDSLYSVKSYERERSVSDIIYFCSAVLN